MSGMIGAKLRANFQARMPTAPARVTSVPLDKGGRSLGYALCDINGSAVAVQVGSNANVQPGDWLIAEQRGGAASASYVAVGFTAGARGDAAIFELPTDMQFGDQTYQRGDLVLGDPLGRHMHYPLAQSAWIMRDGATVQGAIGNLNGLYDYDSVTYGTAFGREWATWWGLDVPNGLRIMRGRTRVAQWREREITLGEDGQPQLRLSPTAIDFLGPDGSVQASMDGATRTIFGFERWGRPLGPALEIGPTDDGRWGWWARGENNVPFFALLSGTGALPDDVYFRVGAQGATDYLEMADGRIRTSCELIAPRGVIGGWTIERDRLTGTGMIKLAGDTAAKRVIIDAGQASYPISAGNDLPASAPFRVGWFGDVWCNSIKSLQGSTNTNVIDVTGNDSSSGAIIGRGGKYGVYGLSGGYGQGAGVYGWTSSGTGSAGVRGFASGGFVGVYGDAQSGTGVYGDGDIGVIADGNTISLKLVGAPMDANAQDIKSVNRLDFGGTQYLYRSGADLYWYNGSTGVKLN